MLELVVFIYKNRSHWFWSGFFQRSTINILTLSFGSTDTELICGVVIMHIGRIVPFLGVYTAIMKCRRSITEGQWSWLGFEAFCEASPPAGLFHRSTPRGKCVCIGLNCHVNAGSRGGRWWEASSEKHLIYFCGRRYFRLV